MPTEGFINLIDYMSNNLLYKESKGKQQIFTFTGYFRDQNAFYNVFLSISGLLSRKSKCHFLLAGHGIGVPDYSEFLDDGEGRKCETFARGERYAR